MENLTFTLSDLIVTDLKDPRNYLKYIKCDPHFINQLKQEYAIASDLKKDILKIQKKLKSTNLRLNSIAKQLNENSSQTDDNEVQEVLKTIVIEPENLIFTISETEVQGVSPNLVFEQKDNSGQAKTQFLYLNQSFKPFLIYL